MCEAGLAVGSTHIRTRRAERMGGLEWMAALHAVATRAAAADMPSRAFSFAQLLAALTQPVIHGMQPLERVLVLLA